MFSVQSQVFSKNRITTEEVQLKINDNKGAFYIEVEGKQEAMMTFVYAGEDKIIIDHTELPSALPLSSVKPRRNEAIGSASTIITTSASAPAQR